MADDYTEGDATPSQAALDSQLAGQKAIQAAQYQGQLGLAKSQIQDAVADGADAAQGRELLGRLDQLQEFPDSEDPVELYSAHKKFLRSAGAAPVAPSDQAPPPTAAKKATDLNKKRAAYAKGEINEYPG